MVLLVWFFFLLEIANHSGILRYWHSNAPSENFICRTHVRLSRFSLWVNNRLVCVEWMYLILYCHLDFFLPTILNNVTATFINIINCDKIWLLQVLVRNVPPDADESVSECVEHFFLVNHQDHYLMHQVWTCWNTSISCRFTDKKDKYLILFWGSDICFLVYTMLLVEAPTLWASDNW